MAGMTVGKTAGSSLWQTVSHFARLTQAISEQDLEQEWVWGDYEEGVRFAFFRVYEELRHLAAELGTVQAASSHPLTTAQRILAQYHAAYRDLQSVLLGVDENLAQQEPAENEWPLIRVLQHIVSADRGFLAINLYALERERTQDERPLDMSEEAWEAFWAGDRFAQIKQQPILSQLLEYLDTHHQRVLQSFKDVTEAELRIPVMYWEKDPLPLQFRLGRFDSHMRQHTVQAEKALLAVRGHPSEARLLLRIIFAALAETEGQLIANPETGVSQQTTAIARISGYTGEIASLLD